MALALALIVALALALIVALALAPFVALIVALVVLTVAVPVALKMLLLVASIVAQSPCFPPFTPMRLNHSTSFQDSVSLPVLLAKDKKFMASVVRTVPSYGDWYRIQQWLLKACTTGGQTCKALVAGDQKASAVPAGCLRVCLFPYL
ncbi:MAG: hypothetical protein FWD43_04865 [Coriobacteriia bacterium]|nr:hypothetical protein [Coriobacteriia bacterium]